MLRDLDQDESMNVPAVCPTLQPLSSFGLFVFWDAQSSDLLYPAQSLSIKIVDFFIPFTPFKKNEFFSHDDWFCQYRRLIHLLEPSWINVLPATLMPRARPFLEPQLSICFLEFVILMFFFWPNIDFFFLVDWTTIGRNFSNRSIQKFTSSFQWPSTVPYFSHSRTRDVHFDFDVSSFLTRPTSSFVYPPCLFVVVWWFWRSILPRPHPRFVVLTLL